MAIYYLYHKEFHYAALCYLIQYIIDCWDGHYARMFNMVSKDGDKLDHYKDYTIGLFLLYFMYKHWNFTVYHFLVLAILFMISNMRFNCIDKLYYHNKDNDKAVQLEEYLCPINENNETIRFLKNTKLLGLGTLTIYVTYLIWNLKK